MSRSSSYDDASLFVPHRDIPIVDESIRPYPIPVPEVHFPPQTVLIEERSRGRSRSRTPSPRRPSPTRICDGASPHRCTSRSRSRSSSPRWRHCGRRRRSISPYSYDRGNLVPRPLRSRTPSPGPPPIVIPGPTINPQQPPPPIFVVPPMSPPSPSPWYARPPSSVWPSQVPRQPVDILTFHYNKNMAYAPAAKTYDEAIDIVVELWPELREVERDQIRLLVTGSDHLVRVPRMTWSAVLCDVPRYEVVHVQVEEQPPPPQYQGKGKGKGKWGGNNEKGRRSSGLFSSIRRIFFG